MSLFTPPMALAFNIPLIPRQWQAHSPDLTCRGNTGHETWSAERERLLANLHKMFRKMVTLLYCLQWCNTSKDIGVRAGVLFRVKIFYALVRWDYASSKTSTRAFVKASYDKCLLLTLLTREIHFLSVTGRGSRHASKWWRIRQIISKNLVAATQSNLSLRLRYEQSITGLRNAS